MTSVCEQLRDALIDLAAGDAIERADVASHLGVCPGCRDRLARWQGHVQALRAVGRSTAPEAVAEAVAGALTPAGRGVRAAAALGGMARRAAPAELEGRVVAALFPGYRQERAVEQVKSMHPVGAPEPLRRRVELVAPGEVELVVAQSEASGAMLREAVRARSRPTMRRVAAVVFVAAAAVLVWVSPIFRPQPAKLSFEVVRGENELLGGDGMARSAASAVLGGYLEVLR
jgi:hypothetical protein